MAQTTNRRFATSVSHSPFTVYFRPANPLFKAKNLESLIKTHQEKKEEISK